MALVNATTGMKTSSESGGFMEKFTLKDVSPCGSLLKSLTFAVKDMFDIEGHVASFGNPTWRRNHLVATSTAPTVLALLTEGAICTGTTITDEMAASILGKNVHYGTPKNTLAPDRVPGGSSSGSAAVVASGEVDFSLATDCLGSARIPASYCGIFGMRPSHHVISGSGVIPLASSLDTVGWFARDAEILRKVGHALLKLPHNAPPTSPSRFIIADDCFQLSTIPSDVLTNKISKVIKKLYGGGVLKHDNLDKYVEAQVKSLKHFSVYNSPTWAAVNCAMQLLERYEFKNNHGAWISTVKPDFGPGIAELIEEILKTTGEHVHLCYAIFREFRDALTKFIGDKGVLIIPTVPGPPPTLQTATTELKNFNERAFCLASVAVVSGFCQITIPLGLHDNLPVSVSLVAKHGDDAFLLNIVENICNHLKGPKALEAEA